MVKIYSQILPKIIFFLTLFFFSNSVAEQNSNFLSLKNNAVNLNNSNAVVENNTIQDNRNSGVYVYANFDHQAVTDTIRNNTVVSNNTNNYDYYAGVYIEEYANPVI